MNVISWENGDKEISDLPACADEYLATLVQSVNDDYCGHTEEIDDFGPALLCADCSVKVIELAHRTVGTAGADPEILRQIALEIFREDESCLHACAYYRRRLGEDVLATWGFTQTIDHVAYHQSVAESGYYSQSSYAEALLALAHKVIDRFEELTGRKAEPVAPEVTRQAVEKMLVTA